MLFELPRKTSDRPTAPRAPASAFEASLRREIAGGPLVSCNPVVGGWLKRGFDLLLLALAAPLWAPVLIFGAAPCWLKKAPAFKALPSVGYGGREFSRYAWSDRAQATSALARRLPQVLNVLRGEMSLVGPLPLSPDALVALRTGVRHYLSARPGVFGIRAVADAKVEAPSHYKAYALTWSPLADAVILWQELRALRREPAD
jgi:lipopolysaccharide/colanic/teichoic acid biosynthesis glycosyltransferase